jgi:hypothetical protein
MTKPDQTPAPEVVSRENAIGARSVEERMAGDLHAMGSVPGMTAASFPGTIDPASHANPAWVEQEHGEPADDSDIQGASPVSSAPRRDQNIAADWLEAGERMAATAQQAVGNVPAMPSPESPASIEEPCTRTREITPLAVTNRLRKEGRWVGQAENTRDELMKASRDNFATKEERQAWAYSELDRMYPPPETKPPIVNDSNTISETPDVSPYVPTKGLADVQVDAGAIQGLSEIPEGWPTLPANASLGAELGWVQANRLRIVEERPGKATSVKLGQALSPAPSWAALGWLETSIRSYAKFVDVAAKAASGGDDDEGAVLRRERKSVDEVRALLDEMKQAEGSCPHCGRPH